jgi:hypothetical protein
MSCVSQPTRSSAATDTAARDCSTRRTDAAACARPRLRNGYVNVLRVLGLTGGLALLLGAAPGPPRTDSIVVRGDVQIGRFLVRRDGTLDGVIRAFDRPSSLRRCRYQNCLARWRDIGLRVNFYNLGGQDPCARQYGYFSEATMVGRHWVTAKGLRLGDPARRLYVLYSPRRFTGFWAWLVMRYSRIGDGGYYPGLAAKIHQGWVTAFRVHYPAGGD